MNVCFSYQERLCLCCSLYYRNGRGFFFYNSEYLIRINTLTHEYELFMMNTNENIQSMQKRFTHIVNHLASLGKTFPNEDLINKVLRCLSRE